MRCVALLAWLLCSCAIPVAVPVEVVGDGERGVVLASGVHAGGLTDCQRATDDDQWAELCGGLGGAFRAMAAENLDFEQRVVVPLAAGMQLIGIVVSSEEGVDVITLDVVGGDVHSTEPATSACLLRLDRRTCQIAIILRDPEQGAERTLAVYSGLD